MSKDHKTKRYVRIDRKKVNNALKGLPVEVVAGHLDLEGVCYIKILRTGAQDCFAADVTSNVLGGNNEQDRYKRQRVFWDKPAMERFGESEK